MSDCIESTGARTSKGYGRVWFRGKSRRAHRVAYVLAHELTLEDIEGVLVCHRCDNPPCVNPEHLFLGTHKENHEDRGRKGRQRTPKGLSNGNGKYTDDQVRQVHHLRAQGMLYRQIATAVGMSKQHVGQIIRGDLRGSV